MTRKPALFIGSSVEGLDVANTVQELLDFDCETTVWSQGVFAPSRTTLAELYVRTRRTDLALFVFTPDDVSTIRGVTSATPRDNVVFELGLFLGALEPDRCFILQPRGVDLHLPSDLLGIAPLTYVPDRRDGNLLAALGPACNQLRRAVRQFEQTSSILKFSEDRRGQATDVRRASLSDYVAEWEGTVKEAWLLAGARPLGSYDEEFAESRPVLRRTFGFLDGLAEAILSNNLDEASARDVFEGIVTEAWPRLATALAPPNHVDDYWNPPPRLSELYVRWRDGAA